MGCPKVIHRMGSASETTKLLLNRLLLSVFFRTVFQSTASGIFFCIRTPIHLHRDCAHLGFFFWGVMNFQCSDPL